jgi:hypothetical protein
MKKSFREGSAYKSTYFALQLVSSLDIPRNCRALLKSLHFLGDIRFNFFCERVQMGLLSRAAFMKEVYSLIEKHSQSTFDIIFSDCSFQVGKALSNSERRSKRIHQSGNASFNYGEIDYSSFYEILRRIPQKVKTGRFYDIGSGTGRAVIAARLTQDFQNCIGIEILSGLHKQALRRVVLFNRSHRSNLFTGQENNISFHCTSFEDFDWSDGDCIFVNSTSFDAKLMGILARMAERLKGQSVIITFTKSLKEYSGEFSVIDSFKRKMSWGRATVFIHQRNEARGVSRGSSKECTEG